MSGETDLETSDFKEVLITEEERDKYKRLDQFLSDKVEELSRSVIKTLFQKGKVYFSEDSPHQGKLELKKMPPAGSLLIVEIPPPLPSEAKAEDLPLEILFEDEHLVIVNKAAGMVTHPAPGNYRGTLVNAVLFHCPDLKGIGDQKRPGIVHRLDKGTSGVMVVAKTAKCHEGLVNLFSTHDIKRQYICLAMGTKMPVGGKLESTIGRHPQNRLKMAVNVRNGKNAITHYKVLEQFEKCTLMQMTLETGRTHQIRVHLSQLLRTPIVMDPLYGQPKDHLKRLPPKVSSLLKDYEYPLLHAKLLGFVHPITGQELCFESDPPETFRKVLQALRENS